MSSEAEIEYDEDSWVWGSQESQPRLLHTMIRVLDLDASIRFYGEGLGMKVLRRLDSDEGRFSLIFMSYTDFDGGPAIELTHNWDVTEAYTQGNGFGHVAIGVPDIHAACDRAEQFGGRVTLRPKYMMPGGPALAFVRDPDDYAIEFIETRR